MPADAGDHSDELLAVAARFALPASPARVEPLGNGNVNDTFLLTLSEEGHPRYVLQRVNTRVFAEPRLIMANLQRLTSHVRRRLEGAAAAGGRWEVPRVVPARAGGDPWVEAGGAFWRLLTFIENCRSLEVLSEPAQARQVGRALGRFHALIADLPVEDLADTLPGFHVTPTYLEHYHRAVAASRVPSSPELEAAMGFVREREAFVPVLEEALAGGRLRLRPIHGDPKVNNVLLDGRSGEAIGLIDLDTVKPGLIHYDIGDCLRSGCNTAGEEATDLEAVRFDPALAEALLRGYLAEASPFLTPADYDHLVDAVRLISFELGLRFLSDHLAGDVYFRTRHRGHNLRRARVQFRLTESIEVQEAALRGLVDRLRQTCEAGESLTAVGPRP